VPFSLNMVKRVHVKASKAFTQGTVKVCIGAREMMLEFQKMENFNPNSHRSSILKVMLRLKSTTASNVADNEIILF